MKNKKIITSLAIVFTLISLLLLAYLSIKHYDLKSGTTTSGSMCNISETFNCDAVSASSYSEFLSIPVSVWGLIAQISLLLLLLIYYFSNSSNAIKMSFVLATINIVAVIVMGGVTVLFLSTYCLFCLLSYLSLLITFLCVWKLQEGFSFNFLRGENRIYLAFLLGVPVAAYITNDIALGETYRNLEKGLGFYILQWKSAPEKEIPLLGAVSYGATEENAKMTIVEFADFNCIHCKHAAPVLHAFVKAHPDTRLLFYHFPLDGACNPSIQRQGVSCDMAKAVYCAHKLTEKGWDGHQAMFETEKPQSLDEAMALIKTVTGVGSEDLAACMQSTDTLKEIETQAKLGTEVGVQGTPTVFVNKKLLQGGNMLPVLKEAYKNIK